MPQRVGSNRKEFPSGILEGLNISDLLHHLFAIDDAYCILPDIRYHVHQFQHIYPRGTRAGIVGVVKGHS